MPPAVRLGAALGPLPGPPPGLRDPSRMAGDRLPSTRAVTIWGTPVARPMRSAAVVTNATIEPSTLLAGEVDGPEPARPSAPAETRLVFMRSCGGRRPRNLRP